MSRGLLVRIARAKWHYCAANLVCGASDYRVATCVRFSAGIGMHRHPMKFVWNGRGMRYNVSRYEILHKIKA